MAWRRVQSALQPMLFASIALLMLARTASAHSPYLTDLTAWIAPDGTKLRIGFINGDSIIGIAPDPARPVVLDETGKVVAVGPRTREGIIRCQSASSCAILQSGILPIKVRPDPSTFRAGRAPDFYPEHEDEVYGFAWSLATPLDYIAIIVAAFTTYPILLGLTAFLGIVCAGLSALVRRSKAWPQIARHLIVLSSLMIDGFAALVLLLCLGSGNWLMFWPACVAFAFAFVATHSFRRFAP